MKIYEKAYTRNYSAIMQQAWYHALESLIKEFSIKHPGHPVVAHVRKGTIDVWMSKGLFEKIEQKISEKNQESNDFFNYHKEKYVQATQYLAKNKNQNKTIKQLRKHIDKIFASIVSYLVVYATAGGKYTPKDLKNAAWKLREIDEYFHISDELITTSLENAHPHTKSYETVVLLQEIEKPPSSKTLQERAKQFTFTKSTHKQETTEQFAKRNNVVFVRETPAQLQGTPVYKPTITGKAKVVQAKQEISEVTKEHILVTPMTTPLFLPAMKKAKAIITDEGGVTSHASIVARELEKPCFIGTKNASERIISGDWLEIDVCSGNIRVLHRS